ncbi:hypothetical protein ACFQZQ_06285 [Lysobacter koreensis]|uniref:Lipocalin-like domain-containing protein n=1 Tax=Lysobacter koreensis TaxID=266122 RepID=A0ABW2YLC3_9GAMM
MKKSLLLGASVLLLAACNAPAPTAPSAAAPPAAATPADPAPAATAPPAATPSPAEPAPPANPALAFADKVWKVSASSGAEVGSTYAFLSGGTLVVDSPNGTPLYGSWTYTDGKLVMTEEGQAYPTDIVEQTATSLKLRSHNPGGVLDIALVPAPEVPLPAAKP